MTIPEEIESYTPDAQTLKEIPQTPNTLPSDEQKPKKAHNMLKRLQSYNSDGLKEGIIAPEEGGRPRRRQLET